LFDTIIGVDALYFTDCSGWGDAGILLRIYKM